MTHLPHQLTENVKLLQKAVLVHQGRILLLKRTKDAQSRPEAWDLPGGNSEWPENERTGFGLHLQDLAREILEETGVEVQPESIDQQHVVYFETYFDSKKQIFSVICGWKVVLPENFAPESVKISHEHSHFTWIYPVNAEQYDFGGEKGEFVREMITRVREK